MQQQFVRARKTKKDAPIWLHAWMQERAQHYRFVRNKSPRPIPPQCNVERKATS